MNLTTQNGVKIISGSVDEFAIKMVNCAKKNVKNHKTYVNANFFAGFKENGEYFTLTVNHLVCDIEATSAPLAKYNKLRGKFVGEKYFYNSYVAQGGVPQFCGHALTTFYIENGKPHMEELTELRDTMTYDIAGITLIKDGKDVM